MPASSRGKDLNPLAEAGLVKVRWSKWRRSNLGVPAAAPFLFHDLATSSAGDVGGFQLKARENRRAKRAGRRFRAAAIQLP
jgi:hypothetical protein